MAAGRLHEQRVVPALGLGQGVLGGGDLSCISRSNSESVSGLTVGFMSPKLPDGRNRKPPGDPAHIPERGHAGGCRAVA